MNTIRVLVVADVSAIRDDIVDAIEQEADLQLVGTATSSSQTLAAVRDTQPEIILIDEALGDTNTLALMQDLVTRNPALTLIAVTRDGHMDYVRQAMLAGARGFVTTPLANGELSQALGQIRRLELTRRNQIEPETPARQHAAQGTVIAIYSPKGGVGKTTLAANLSVVLARRTHQRVVVVDNNPQFGHLGLVLNVHANYNLMDLLSRSDDLDLELVEGMVTSHASGVHVLLSPTEIERADAFPPQAVSNLLSMLRTMYDWIIVDSWPVLTESTLDVLEAADRVLLMLVPDITCLRDTKQFFELIESLDFPLSKFDIIVNRATVGGLDREAIEEGLRRKVAMEIPQDDPLVTYSLNRGVPLVISHKRSPVSKAVGQLAGRFTTDRETPVRLRGRRPVLKRLFGVAG
ncbi:MAG: AAA family ATPase [Anaerolineae bacterium]